MFVDDCIFDDDKKRSEFYRTIEEMIEYHQKYKPFKLKGTYAPIYTGPVLQAFFEASNGFGPLDPISWKKNSVMGPLLMDTLPYVKQGYMLRNTLTILFFLYVRTMDLQEPENSQYSHYDNVMEKIFTEMNAEFYTTDGVLKIPMVDAVAKGLIKAPLSTQDVIRLKRPEFNDKRTAIIRDAPEDKQIYREAFPNYFFQLLASRNYFSKEDLKENDNYFKILETLEKVTNQMILEHNIVKETSLKWNEYLEPFRKANRDKKRKESEIINDIVNDDTINTSELRKRI